MFLNSPMNGGLTSWVIENVINLNNYPIHTPYDNHTQKLMQESHNTFLETGLLTLPKFLLPGIAEQAAQTLSIKRDIMCECDVEHNIYQFDDNNPFYNDLHPRNVKMHSKFFTLPYDDIPLSSTLHTIYNWDLMTRFISAIVYGPYDINGNLHNESVIYRFDDPLAAVTCNVLFNGHIVDWHFDQAPFAVIILLQNGDNGGGYQVAPDALYSNGQYDYSLHNDIINENDPAYSKVTDTYYFEPGDLVIHRGTHSIHRVTTVFGNKPRMTAVFTYAPQPNMTLTPTVRETTYCRQEARQ
eukprot:279316_1